MLMTGLLRLLAAFLLFSFASMASAATLTVNGSGQLTGATGVLVDGTLYDVIFTDGTCAAQFNGCNSPSNFVFASAQGSIDASQALLDQVLINGPDGFFDRDYALTLGCATSNNLEGRCNVLVPYEEVGANFDAYGAANTPLTTNGVALPNDTITLSNASINFDTAANGAVTWAVFTPSVPEPTTWTMMLLGFGAIGRALRCKKRALQPA